MRRTIPILLLLALAGCGPTEVDTTYGRSRGPSINGTSAFAELIRRRGSEVRVAVRLTGKLSDWADVLVRFAPYPGPPDRAEGGWMLEWLNKGPGRRVIYVARDYDAAPEFWDRMVAHLDPKTADDLAGRIRRKRDLSRAWMSDLPPKATKPATPEEWFAVDPGPPSPAACKLLEGPWAEGVDAGAAAIPRHEGFRAGQEEILLGGDGTPLAMTWTVAGGSAALAVANGSFLLNAALLNRARRPLAIRAVDWIGPGPRKVAFVEGADVLGAEAEAASASPLRLLQVPPFGWVAAHLGAFGLLLCLSLAATLGRPRPAPPAGTEHPSAHPEALGSLLARTGRADFARSLLETYRRWRRPARAAAGAVPPANHPPTRAPLA